MRFNLYFSNEEISIITKTAAAVAQVFPGNSTPAQVSEFAITKQHFELYGIQTSDAYRLTFIMSPLGLEAVSRIITTYMDVIGDAIAMAIPMIRVLMRGVARYVEAAEEAKKLFQR